MESTMPLKQTFQALRMSSSGVANYSLFYCNNQNNNQWLVKNNGSLKKKKQKKTGEESGEIKPKIKDKFQMLNFCGSKCPWNAYSIGVMPVACHCMLDVIFLEM